MKGTGFKYRVTCEAGGLKKPLNIGYSNKRRAIKAHAKEVQPLGWEDPLEKEIATHSNILAWEIPWTEELDGLQSMESQRVRQDLGTKQQEGPT